MHAPAIFPGSGLARDQRGAVLVEFALLAPALLILLLGVFQVGVHVQNSNAVRNLASDGARWAVVQYQRGNTLTTEQVGMGIRARGIGAKFNLKPERLAVDVTQPNSRIAGVREMHIRITYDAPNFLGFAKVPALGIAYERPVFLLFTPPPSPPPGT
jgi:Flp pilus assembly pilin Flp